MQYPEKIRIIINEIKDEYQSDNENIPWVIGFSGGKDSTVLLTLVWLALQELKEEHITLRRYIYILYNDTLVENPVIAQYVKQVLGQIRIALGIQNLPISVHISRPEINHTFWVSVIGKGYPVPNMSFRWCTDRLKISSTNRFIEKNIIGKHHKAIILVGTRFDESQARARSMSKNGALKSRLSKHNTNKNAWVYSPIKYLNFEEVWVILHSIQSPWGGNNKILGKIYKDASADDYECPVFTENKNQKSCGNSRFGCWVCTVISKDKSTGKLIKNGYKQLKPLLDFRNELATQRNNPNTRNRFRKDGIDAVNGMGQYKKIYRIKLLKKLLKIQKKLQLELISTKELYEIQKEWVRDGLTQIKVSTIYNQINGQNSLSETTITYNRQEFLFLEQICKNKNMALLLQNMAQDLEQNRPQTILQQQRTIKIKIRKFLKEQEVQSKR